jgi:type IV secretion system protein VirD4
MNMAISDDTGRIIIKVGFGFILAAIAWTVVASLVFLLGTGLLHDFPHPFYQWWLYALNFDGNPRVALWLKIGAGAGVVFPVTMIAAVIYRGQQVVGPRLRRPFFGGAVKSPLAVTDNHGHSRWLTMEEAKERFPGPNRDFGGLVVGECYRVDQDKKSRGRFIPSNQQTWGIGGQAPLLIDPCEIGSTHAMLISGPGGYKTSTAVSNLLHWRGSAIVLDPSGELSPMVTSARRKMGQKIFDLNPACEIGFNVLAWIDITDPLAESNIDTVVGWICGDVKLDKDGKEDFFDGQGRNVLRLLIAHVLWDSDIPPELKHLKTVHAVIAMRTDQVRSILKKIYEYSTAPYARKLAGPICGLVEETFSGICGSAAELTKWLANSAFMKLVSSDSFTIADVLAGRTTVFLNIPLKVLQTTPGVARTVIGALMQGVYEADGQVDGRVLFLLDEVARLGYMSIIEIARDAGRKYGITMMLYYQSSGQLTSQWGDKAEESWFNSLSWRAYAAIQDDRTAEDLEKWLGTYGVMASSEGTNTGTSGKGFESGSRSRGANISYHEISRPLIRAAELKQDVRADEAFVIIGGSFPLRCGRAIYFRRPEMLSQIKKNRFYKPVTR